MAITFAENDRALGEVFLRLSQSADEFEGYTRPHAARIAAIAGALAASFRLAREDRSSLVFASLLHDVGEMVMKRDYIGRAGPLTEAERLDLARHPIIGEQEASRAGADRGVQLLVRWHHEWWNGAGYPDALRGEQIPLAARILRVADAYASLTDERPFRPAGTEAEARKHLTLWAGIEFDPRVVSSLLALEGLPALRSVAATLPVNEYQSAEPHHVQEPALADQQRQATDELTGGEKAVDEKGYDAREDAVLEDEGAAPPDVVHAGGQQPEHAGDLTSHN